MKKENLSLVFVFILGILIFYSCKEEYGPNPSIEFLQASGYISQNDSCAPGDSVTVGLICRWNGQDLLTEITSYLNDEYVKTTNINLDVVIIDQKLYKTKEKADNWVFELTDASGQKVSAGITLTIDTAEIDIRDIEGITVGAQENNSIGSFYAIDSSLSYTLTEAEVEEYQAVIDFVCASNNENNIFISSTGYNNWNGIYDFSAWTNLRKTQFGKISLTDDAYDVLTKTEITKKFNAATKDSLTREIAEGNIYTFKTQSSKYGVLKVISVKQGNSGSVTFDIKIQK